MKMVLEFGAQGGLKLNRNLSCIFIYIFHGLPTFFFSADLHYVCIYTYVCIYNIHMCMNPKTGKLHDVQFKN